LNTFGHPVDAADLTFLLLSVMSNKVEIRLAIFFNVTFKISLHSTVLDDVEFD